MPKNRAAVYAQIWANWLRRELCVQMKISWAGSPLLIRAETYAETRSSVCLRSAGIWLDSASRACR